MKRLALLATLFLASCDGDQPSEVICEQPGGTVNLILLHKYEAQRPFEVFFTSSTFVTIRCK